MKTLRKKKITAFFAVLIFALQILFQGADLWAADAVLNPAALQVPVTSLSAAETEQAKPSEAAVELVTSEQFLAGSPLAPAAEKEPVSAPPPARQLVQPVVDGFPLGSGTYNYTLPGNPVLFNGKGDTDHDAAMGHIQISDSEFSFSYQLPDADDFVFSGLSFPVAQDFSLPGRRIAMAMSSIPTGKQIKVEVKDVNGLMAIFYANLAGEKRTYDFPLDPEVLPDGFDKTKIKEIVLVAEKFRSGETGIVDVEINGLYCPFVSPAETSGWMTLKPPFIPSTYVMSPASADAVSIANGSGIYMNFNTSTVGWAGGGLTFDNAATPAFETADMSDISSNLVFALRGSTDQFNLEVIDDQGRKAIAKLGGIRADIDQIWSVSKSRFNGTIDWTKVRSINFITGGIHKTGFLEISLRKDPAVDVIDRDVNGYIRRALVRYPDGRLYTITGTPEGVKVLRTNPYSWRSGYSDREEITIPNFALQGVGLIYLTDGLEVMLEGMRLKPDGNSVKAYSVVFTPAAHGMKHVPLVMAPSNPNFAFFDDPWESPYGIKNNVRTNSGMLLLIDLRTGKLQFLASNDYAAYRGMIYTPGKYDVSPDGSHVFFEVASKDLYAGNQYWLVTQNISNPNRRIFVPAGVYLAPATSIVFSCFAGGYAALQITDQNGLIRILRIDLTTGWYFWNWI